MKKPKKPSKQEIKANAIKAREDLRKWLVKYSKCDIQEGQGGDWPCGTCVIGLLSDMGLSARKKEYKEHNDPVDRSNEVWRAILQIRDAKL